MPAISIAIYDMTHIVNVGDATQPLLISYVIILTWQALNRAAEFRKTANPRLNR